MARFFILTQRRQHKVDAFSSYKQKFQNNTIIPKAHIPGAIPEVVSGGSLRRQPPGKVGEKTPITGVIEPFLNKIRKQVLNNPERALLLLSSRQINVF